MDTDLKKVTDFRNKNRFEKWKQIKGEPNLRDYRLRAGSRNTIHSCPGSNRHWGRERNLRVGYERVKG